MPRIQSWAIEAQKKLEAQYGKFVVALHYHKVDQAVGSCPFCKEGEDRFVVFEEGNYWCRVCRQKGFWEENRISADELKAKQLLREKHRLEIRASIATCTDWQQYHSQVVNGLDDWKKVGIDQKDIDRWGLGFCTQAPCMEYPSASLTIPIFHRNTLVDIRHRLLSPQSENERYRSHIPGLPPAFLNLDAIKDGSTVYWVEGEKKTIVLEHYGLHPVISYPGVNSGKALSHILAQECTKSQRLVFLPDPGSESQLVSVWKELAKSYKVGVVELIRKPDDFVSEFGFEALKNALVYPQWV